MSPSPWFPELSPPPTPEELEAEEQFQQIAEAMFIGARLAKIRADLMEMTEKHAEELMRINKD